MTPLSYLHFSDLTVSTAVLTVKLLALVITLLGVARITIRAFAGPLSSLPGPVLNKLTEWPLRFATITGRRSMYIDDLYRRYGSVIRIAPREVAINDLDATKEIHRIGSGFTKSTWYLDINNSHADPGIFSMTDPKTHASRRRVFSRPFSSNGIAAFEPLIHEKVEAAIDGMRKFAENGKQDVLKWWTFMATDVMAELGFGESFHMLETGKTCDYVADLTNTLIVSSFRVELPWLHFIGRHLPIGPLKHLFQGEERCVEYGRQALQKYKRLDEAGAVGRTFFTDLISTMPTQQVESEARNLLAAGTDTTAVTLTYLTWMILKHPEVRAKVMAEVDALPTEPTSSSIATLPYLEYVTKETLRLYGAAPGSLPRKVPKGGRVLGGWYIPEGATVSTQAYSLHRDPNIFVNPHMFMPERWITASQAMKDAFMPFGGGTRVCLGIHLAKSEIALGIVTFLRAFPHARLGQETDDNSMEIENYFLIAPKSHRCYVQLE